MNLEQEKFVPLQKLPWKLNLLVHPLKLELAFLRHQQEFLSYGQLISNVHVKDCTPSDYTVQLGDGNVNFSEVFSLLKKNNYKKDFILQGARGNDDVQTAKRQLEFTKKYISKYFLWI